MLIFLSINYMGDVATQLNLGALFAANLMVSALLYCIPNNYDSLIYFFASLRKHLLYLAIFGIAFSTALSPIFHIDNPVIDFFTGSRVRIFSRGVGHTPLIEAGVLIFFITLALFDFKKMRRDLMFVFAGLMFVYFARTAIGYIGIIAAGFVWAIENSKIGFYYKNLTYAILVPSFFLLYASYGDELLLSVRTFQVGVRSVNAGSSDLSSGRTELNYYLTQVIEQHPWTGAGVTNKIIENGVRDSGGHLIAMVESPLRMGAKYGVFYLGMMLILCLYSSLTLFMTDIRFRIIGLSLTLYNINGFLGNGLFETPQSWNSFVLFFPTILIGEFARRSRTKKPAVRFRYQQPFAQHPTAR